MYIFFINFVFWSNFFSILSKLRTGLSKLKSTCRQETFEENKVFLKKLWVYLSFSEMSKKLSSFWRKLFGRVVNTAFDVGIGLFWEVFFAPWANPFRRTVEGFPLGMSEKRSKFLIISWHWAENFWPFVKKIEAGLPELLSTCLQEQFERFSFLQKVLNLFFLFRTLSKKFSIFCQFFSMGLPIVYSTCP